MATTYPALSSVSLAFAFSVSSHTPLIRPSPSPTLWSPLIPPTCQLMPIRPAVDWCGGRVWDWDHLAIAHSWPLLPTCQDPASLCCAPQKSQKSGLPNLPMLWFINAGTHSFDHIVWVCYLYILLTSLTGFYLGQSSFYWWLIHVRTWRLVWADCCI